jgi:hypothetical protein
MKFLITQFACSENILGIFKVADLLKMITDFAGKKQLGRNP